MDWDELMDAYRATHIDVAAELCTRIVESVAGAHLYYPPTLNGLVLEVLVDHAPFRAGDRGLLRCGYGTSMYDWHREVPMEGVGVPIEDVAVVWCDARDAIVRTAYAAWCEEHGARIVCGRCGEEVDLFGRTRCSARSRQRDVAAANARRRSEIERRRDAWAKNVGADEEPPVLPAPLHDAQVLVLYVSTLERAHQVGAGYQLDFSGVHIVESDEGLEIWAQALRDPADGEPHPFGPPTQRRWPIPLLTK